MRRNHLLAGATLAVLSAALPALAAPEACAAPGAEAASTPKLGPPLVPTPEQIPYPRVTDAHGGVALDLLLRGGSEIYDLGTNGDGLRSLFVLRREQQRLAVFHILPGGKRAIAGGEVIDFSVPPGQRDATTPKLRRIPGMVPTVDARNMRPPPADFAALERASYGLLGDPSAPRVWMLFDPLCHYSGPALDALRPAIDAGKLHVALLPVPILDPRGNGPSTRAAATLVTTSKDRVGEVWTAMLDSVRARRPLPEPPSGSGTLVARNKEAAAAFGAINSPTFLWVGADGRPAGVVGGDESAAILAGAVRR